MRYLAGYISASYNPLKVSDAPTIVSVTAGDSQVVVGARYPANFNYGASNPTTFTFVASPGGASASVTAPAASPGVISVTVYTTITGLTNGVTYTVQVFATNSYGPSAFSAPSGSFVPLSRKLYSWGYNNFGQLGQNDKVNRSSPVQIGALSTWLNISTGYYSSIATKTDGTLWSWGSNSFGQLGQNNTVYKSSPVQVGALTTWLNISVGTYSCLATKTDGTLWSWGSNNAGQLGQNDKVYRSSPVQIGALTTWSKISVGYSSCLATKTDGTLWSWGLNNNGQLGQNIAYSVNKSSPVQVGALTTWLNISSGLYTCLATKTDGTLWAWGYNNNGQLGQNIAYTVNRSSPVQVGALTTWSNISSGRYSCLATKTDGTLWSWGRNTNGQLGDNTIANRSSPVQVGALTTWLNINVGFYSCLATKTDGTLWSWGNNLYGQLGDNTIINKSSPVQVGALTTWSNISVGICSSLATSS